MADLPEAERKSIEQYVNAESPNDDQVVLIQKIGSRRIVGRTHELYDVHCEKTRWWVVTDPTNLYLQSDFPEIEQAFIFHLGLGLFLAERSRGTLDEPEDRLISGSWRRFRQALEAMDSAHEAEDFQAVGIVCRQALLALVKDYASADWLSVEDETKPKAADFKGWFALIAAALSAGRIRSYATALGERTWDLTVWLQHYEDATPIDAELVLDAVQHLLSLTNMLAHRREHGEVERCPQCGSYRLEEAMNIIESPEHGFVTYQVCSACAWQSEQTFTSYGAHFSLTSPGQIEAYLGSPGVISDRLNRGSISTEQSGSEAETHDVKDC